MRKSTTPFIHIGSINVPVELAADVRELLRDPRTGRTRYGEMTNLIVRLLSNWVDERRLISIQHPSPPKELFNP